jgi:DNA repair ATPase RecN
MDIIELKQQFTRLSNTLHEKLGVKTTLEKQLKESCNRVQQINQETELLTKVSLFLQTLSDITRQQIVDKISVIVTDALQKVKDSNLEFKMLISTERNQSDVKFVVKNKLNEQEYDILTSYGGSIADIITFPLRVSLLMKWDTTLSKILILDESFKFVSKQDQPILAEFVQQLSEKLNLQIILVTHSSELTAKGHKIFKVDQKNGISNIEVLPS